MIAVYFLIPTIESALVSSDRSTLLKGPVYINNETVVKTQDKISSYYKKPEKNSDIPYARKNSTSINKKHNYKYSLSLVCLAGLFLAESKQGIVC